MRGRDLLQDMEFIDDKLVEEASQISSKTKRTRINKTYWMRYGSIAACLVIIVVGSNIAIQQHRNGEKTESISIADTTMENTAGVVGQETCEEEIAVDGAYDRAENKMSAIAEKEKDEMKQDAIVKDTASLESALEESDVIHLDFYDSFAYYNEHDIYHGFKVSEEDCDGVLFYLFYYEEKDMSFWVNAEQTQGRLVCGDQDVIFAIQGMIAEGANEGNIFLMDVTDDGKDEFIYYYIDEKQEKTYEILVYDLETMMPCELQDEVLERIELQIEELEHK